MEISTPANPFETPQGVFNAVSRIPNQDYRRWMAYAQLVAALKPMDDEGKQPSLSTHLLAQTVLEGAGIHTTPGLRARLRGGSYRTQGSSGISDVCKILYARPESGEEHFYALIRAGMFADMKLLCLPASLASQRHGKIIQKIGADALTERNRRRDMIVPMSGVPEELKIIRPR